MHSRLTRRVKVVLESQRGDKRSEAIFIGATAIQISDGFFLVHIIAGSDDGFLLAVGAVNNHERPGQ